MQPTTSPACTPLPSAGRHGASAARARRSGSTTTITSAAPTIARTRRATARHPQRVDRHCAGDATPRRRGAPPPRATDGSPAARAARPVRRPARPASRAARKSSYLTSQWFADQGFAVVVIDGRGTPGRGIGVGARRATATSPPRCSSDQVEGLHALAAEAARSSTSRASRIRGWSFGGYLAALAVLAPPRRVPRRRRRRTGHRVAALRHPLHRALPRRPGRRRRAVRPRASLAAAGRPSSPGRCCSCTAWPTTTSSPRTRCSSPRRCSPPASRTRCCRSSACTHMTPQEVVAENLLLHQLEFLRRSLGIDS